MPPTTITKPMYEGTPGKVEFRVTDFQAGDPRFQRPDGGGNTGLSIAQLREQFGGDEGEMKDPFLGQTHHLSLKQWADADPDTTYLHIYYRFIPDREKGQ